MRALSIAALLAALVLVTTTPAQPPKDKADPKTKKADSKAKGKDDPEPKFNLKMTVKDIRLGTHLMGPVVSEADLSGHVVLLDYWGIACPPCLAAMPGLASLNAELGDFGLVLLGSHVQAGTPEEIKLAATKRGVNFPISSFTRASGSDDSRGIPHSLLFDHKGACVFRGHPKDAETLVRPLLGEALVAAAGREKFSPALQPIVKDLKAGKPPATILPRVAALRNSKGEGGEDARALLDAMTAAGQKKLMQAEASTDPVEAFLLIEKLPNAYKGAPIAQKATEMVGKLKKEKSVQAEINSRTTLEAVRKLDLQLGAAVGDQDPKKPEFQKAAAVPLKELKAKARQMKASWPDARGTKEALEICERWGVEVK